MSLHLRRPDGLLQGVIEYTALSPQLPPGLKAMADASMRDVARQADENTLRSLALAASGSPYEEWDPDLGTRSQPAHHGDGIPAYRDLLDLPLDFRPPKLNLESAREAAA